MGKLLTFPLFSNPIFIFIFYVIYFFRVVMSREREIHCRGNLDTYVVGHATESALAPGAKPVARSQDGNENAGGVADGAKAQRRQIRDLDHQLSVGPPAAVHGLPCSVHYLHRRDGCTR
jgi:hypothetical protein